MDRPQGRHGFDHRKPVCLARRTPGSLHARMLIGTSISWIMSANWANEFVAECKADVMAVEEEEEEDGTKWKGTHLDAHMQMLTRASFPRSCRVNK